MVMEQSKKKVSCKSIIKNLFNLQLGLDADQALFSYHTTLNSLLNLKPTKGLQNDPTIGDRHVSGIQFNNKGTLLANSYWAEDKIQIWDWYKGRLKKIFSTGHKCAAMYFNWVPCDDENLFVTSGQEGDLRLIDLTTNESRPLLETYTGGQDSDPMARTYRFSVNQNLPHVILAAGYTGRIVYIDIRDENPTDLLTIKHGNGKYEIHSVDINPVKCSEFCVGGINNVRIYDHRNSSEPVQEFSLVEQNAEDSNSASTQEENYIDNVKYNFNGTEVMASSTSNPIYLFDTSRQKAPKEFATVRCPRHWHSICGAHFCGQKSEFVVTISSISQDYERFHTLYIWDKETREVVREMPLSEDSWRFTVHPSLPVLAMNWNDEGIRLWQ